MEHIKDWLISGVGAIALGFALKWAYNKGCELVVDYAMRQLMLGLQGGGARDEDVREFVHDITLAFIKLAEKRLPDSGLGPERKKWVVDQLTHRLPILKGKEIILGDIIDKLVSTMDCQLKRSIQDEQHPTA